MLTSLCLFVGSMNAVVDCLFSFFLHFGVYRFSELLEDLGGMSVPKYPIVALYVTHTSSPSGEEAIDLESKGQC